MESDFYSVLDVPPDSSQATIQAAYRKLARRWHPDLNGDQRAAAEFALISQAYAVLGNEDRRSAYNRSLRARSSLPATPVPTRPICCTECGAITARPRILLFRSTIGLGVWNAIERTEGVFCSRCARRVGLKASVLTALTGWWALPFGPFFTAWCIGSNARGGSRRPNADRRLTLLNAQAFLERDNFNLAYALARHALDGANEADANKAHDIIAQAKAQGIKDGMITLKDPWRASLSYLGLHALLLLALPAALIAAALMIRGG